MFRFTALIGLTACCAVVFYAQKSGMAITVPTVPVIHAGNDPDTEVMTTDGTTGYGSVGYNYRVGATEVTNAQYVAFLNAVAATDTFGLYNPSMASGGWGGITRSGSPGSYVYSIKADIGGYTYADKPVVYVSWYDALRFANWLHNGQPTGAQDASTTEDGAYTFGGAISVGPRNVGAIWALTSEDEWYKAAYYHGATNTYYDFPTGTDTTPNNNLPSSDTGNSANFFDNDYTTGDNQLPLTDAGAYLSSTSPYGTFDQGGNVAEWNESVISTVFRAWRGGTWFNSSLVLPASYRADLVSTGETNYLGFRVVLVPEPGGALLAIMACLSVFMLKRGFA